MDFTGKTVLVTGAGKGIGRATALFLAARGATIIAVSRSPTDLSVLASELGCRTRAVDLADADATRAAAEIAESADFLVNCAGTTQLDAILDVTTETFDAIMAVNCRAPLLMTQAYARGRMAIARSGAVVNVSSIASTIGLANHAGLLRLQGCVGRVDRRDGHRTRSARHPGQCREPRRHALAYPHRCSKSGSGRDPSLFRTSESPSSPRTAAVDRFLIPSPVFAVVC